MIRVARIGKDSGDIVLLILESLHFQVLETSDVYVK